jgi:hypothetical protein
LAWLWVAIRSRLYAIGIGGARRYSSRTLTRASNSIQPDDRSSPSLVKSAPAAESVGAHLLLLSGRHPATAAASPTRASSPRRTAGSHWSSPTQPAGPTGGFNIANTSRGRMVGDYISTSFNAKRPSGDRVRGGRPTKRTARVRRGNVRPRPRRSRSRPTRLASRAAAAGGTGQGELLRSIRHN